MVFEGSKLSEDTVDESSLEKYKGNTDAPFEVVNKDEELSVYPYSFSKKIKTNWTKVCDLMDWKKSGAPIDWNYFKVAKDPFQVVISIQEKILKQGSRLPVYGVDGKFGTETESALDYVIDRMAKKDEAVVTRFREVDQAPELTVTPAVSDFSDRDNSPQLEVSDEKMTFQQKFIHLRGKELISSISKIDARLEAADLDGLFIDENWVEGPDFNENSVRDFQVRARKFREELVKEEPKLEALNKFDDKLIPIIEHSLEKIDLKDINSFYDLIMAFDKITKTTEELSKDEKLLGDKEFEKLALDLNVRIDILMSFFGAFLLEVLVLTLKYFKKDEQNFKRIVNLLKFNRLIRRKDEGI